MGPSGAGSKMQRLVQSTDRMCCSTPSTFRIPPMEEKWCCTRFEKYTSSRWPRSNRPRECLWYWRKGNTTYESLVSFNTFDTAKGIEGHRHCSTSVHKNVEGVANGERESTIRDPMKTEIARRNLDSRPHLVLSATEAQCWSYTLLQPSIQGSERSGQWKRKA